MKTHRDGASPVVVLTSVVAVATALGGISYAAWEINWARQAANADRQSVVSRENQGFQQARLDEITRKMSDLATLKALGSTMAGDPVNQAANEAQQTALKNIICTDYRQLSEPVKGTLETDLVNTLQVMCQVSQP